MSEDESYKKFLARVRAICIVWFFSTPAIILFFVVDQVRASLSILAFAIIISWTFLLTILTEDKENLSKNINMLTGSEETKDISTKQAKSPLNGQVKNTINIPKDYFPEPETEQTTGTLNLGGNDLGKEIGSSVFFILSFVSLYLVLDHYFFPYFQASHLFFICSFLYVLLAFWRLQKAYFKKGWVKVFARPNNIVAEISDSGTEGGPLSERITEGWTFSVDGKQYNVRQRSENHYKTEQEIFWNPQTNKLIINHNGYRVLIFFYSLVAYFFFFLGLLFSNQLALHPVTVFPVTVICFAPVLPTGLIIFCEMYFNQVTLDTVFSKLIMAALIILGALSLLVFTKALWDWVFSDTGCSFWMHLSACT